eukprot:364188-Chlamydomonas_euryale.AAC.10
MSSSRGPQQTIRGAFGIRHEGEPETMAVALAIRSLGHPQRAPAPMQPVILGHGHGSCLIRLVIA